MEKKTLKQPVKLMKRMEANLFILFSPQTKDGTFWLTHPICLEKETNYAIPPEYFEHKQFYTMKDLKYLMTETQNTMIDFEAWRKLNEEFQTLHSDLLGKQLKEKIDNLQISSIVDTTLRKLEYFNLT